MECSICEINGKAELGEPHVTLKILYIAGY